MTAAMSQTAFTAVSAAPAKRIIPAAVASPTLDSAPTLGGQGRLSRFVELVSRGLTASWVPFCPDLTNEISRLDR